MEAPPAAPVAVATFNTAANTQPTVRGRLPDHLLRVHMIRCGDPPGALAVAVNGLPGTEVAGEGASVIPDNGMVWLADAGASGLRLLKELATGVAVGAGLEAGEGAAGVAGMSYFCSCNRYVSAV